MPKKPRKPCAFPGCPNLTDKRYCAEHEKVINDRYNKYERPYDSSVRYGKEWKRIRNHYIKQHPLCEECKRNGKLTVATEVHHIVPLGNGGTHDDKNLMSLCKPCHSRITAESGDRWSRK
ncbi:MAG: HNH endonuclease signature motif containing protein [Clostridia bacterium]|nr:HNH endonuclease signature motif containing protein [Clostridia bacterium]